MLATSADARAEDTVTITDPAADTTVTIGPGFQPFVGKITVSSGFTPCYVCSIQPDGQGPDKTIMTVKCFKPDPNNSSKSIFRSLFNTKYYRFLKKQVFAFRLGGSGGTPAKLIESSNDGLTIIKQP